MHNEEAPSDEGHFLYYAIILMLTFISVLGTLLLALQHLQKPAPNPSPVTNPTPLLAPTSSKPPEPVERLLGRFNSLYKLAEKDDRVHNIEMGAKKLDGSVFMPGEVWSFNKMLGPRTKETGFRDAPVLFMGEVLQDVGGGMCQVSSTVFAAAVNVGFKIIQRYPHSRPSSYMPRGLDATVNYPEQCWGDKQDPNICFDVKLQNPYSFPVTIKTLTRSWNVDEKAQGHRRELVIELWGIGPVAEVATHWKLYSTRDYKRRWRKGWKPGTWSKKSQEGKQGLRGALYVNTLWPDGHKTHTILVSDYKPVDEVWWVGRDWEGGDPWE